MVVLNEGRQIRNDWLRRKIRGNRKCPDRSGCPSGRPAVKLLSEQLSWSALAATSGCSGLATSNFTDAVSLTFQ